MLMLGMDSATSACSAAVVKDGDVLAQEFEGMARGHAEALVPIIKRVLEAAGYSVGELDLIAATVGPGAYTGVRIGLSTAQTMSLAANVPLLGVTTLEAVARAAQDGSGKELLVVLDTKRADFYVQAFDGEGMATGEPAALTADELLAAFPDSGLRLAGDAAERAAAAFRDVGRAVELLDVPGIPDSAWVAQIGGERAAEARVGTATPLYLRPPDVGPPGGRRQ